MHCAFDVCKLYYLALYFSSIALSFLVENLKCLNIHGTVRHVSNNAHYRIDVPFAVEISC